MTNAYENAVFNEHFSMISIMWKNSYNPTILTCILCGILKWGTCHHGWIVRNVDYENSTNRI